MIVVFPRRYAPGTFAAMFRSLLVAFLFLITSVLNAQVLTSEDSLSAGLHPTGQKTYLSGYGELKVSYDMALGTGTANLTRNVLFVGHRFNPKLSFFSEMELENARVEGGGAAGELSMEQLFLKFDLNKDLYFVGGLFIPRIGIINENHLPTTFNGNDRPFVEQLVIPSTWREIGAGVYGRSARIPGLNWSLAVQTGLDAGAFTNGSGIREGRQGGSNASASNLAITGAVLYYWNDLRVQASGYYGGAAGLTQREADSLQLDYGAFGTPVSMLEADAQWRSDAWSVKALVVNVSIPEAQRINRAYANNTPERMTGAYCELGYDLLTLIGQGEQRDLTVFARYENVDLEAALPDNGIPNGVNRKQYVVAGLVYKPVTGISVKVDLVTRFTGEPNPDLVVNPYPQAMPYYSTNSFLNIGLAYSF